MYNFSSEKQAKVVQQRTDDTVDEAADFVGGCATEYDATFEAGVVRKIDWFFMPAMVFGYGFVYYDKAILGSAVLFGMTSDLQLEVVLNSNTDPPTVTTDRLSWATSLFYFGMLAGVYPMSLLLQRSRVRWVLGPLVILWGAICMLTAAVTSWRGLYCQRFFLGFVESIIPTAFTTIISGYYTQQEQALRQSWWFSSTGLFTAIGAALNYGFAQISGSVLKSWQYIYLMAGSLTIVFGFLCFAVPDSPMDAWFLSQRQRLVAVERLRKGQTGVRNHALKGYQIREALFDVKYYLIFLAMFTAYTINGAVSGFGPLIVKTFGWSVLDSILFQLPLGFLVFILILLTGYVSSKRKDILIPQLLLCSLPVIAACAIIWKSTWSYHASAPIVGYVLLGFFGPVVSLVIIAGITNVAGATKKSLMSANLFVAYCVGNIVGPQCVKSETKDRHYPELWTALITFYCVLIMTSLILYTYLRRQNKVRAQERSNLSHGMRYETGFKDLTDKENLFFQYSL